MYKTGGFEPVKNTVFPVAGGNRIIIVIITRDINRPVGNGNCVHGNVFQALGKREFLPHTVYPAISMGIISVKIISRYADLASEHAIE